MDQTEETFSHFTLIAIEAALLAGNELRQGFGKACRISQKEGIHNLVTEYDQIAENKILEFLSQNVPESAFLAEESGRSGPQPKDLLWIIDPLDGTVNFAHHLPLFAVSIALEKEGKLFSGVIYQPLTHELFVAEKKKGSFLNGERIAVSSTTELSASILATGLPYNLRENPFHCIEHFIDILRLGIPIRRMGSAALDLAYTAAGKFDGYFEVGLSPWDCAAGKLILEEAQGKITGWDNRPFDIHARTPLFASNGRIHEEMRKVLNRETP